jgi:hypothetical protein
MEAKLKNFKGDQIKPTEYKKSKKKRSDNYSSNSDYSHLWKSIYINRIQNLHPKNSKIYSNLM